MPAMAHEIDQTDQHMEIADMTHLYSYPHQRNHDSQALAPSEIFPLLLAWLSTASIFVTLQPACRYGRAVFQQTSEGQ